MTETTKYFCMDQNIPSEFVWIANRDAIQENPDNQPFFEAATIGRRWQPGRTLHVAFLEGSPQLQQKVASYAKQWMRYANITFLFDNHPKAEIRITFQPGAGTYSYLGTDALLPSIAPDQATMNYDDLTANSSDEVFSFYVLHEFGHALGLIHEHQQPVAGIMWDKVAVRLAYPNFTEEQLEENIFKRYTRSQTQYSNFDPASIMVYRIPRSWTLNGIETPQNIVLSETDKRYIEKWYPW